MTVPLLLTERLRLRGWREEGLDAYAPINADPETRRWFPGTLDRAQAWREIAMWVGHWELAVSGTGPSS